MATASPRFPRGGERRGVSGLRCTAARNSWEEEEQASRLGVQHGHWIPMLLCSVPRACPLLAASSFCISLTERQGDKIPNKPEHSLLQFSKPPLSSLGADQTIPILSPKFDPCVLDLKTTSGYESRRTVLLSDSPPEQGEGFGWAPSLPGAHLFTRSLVAQPNRLTLVALGRVDQMFGEMPAPRQLSNALSRAVSTLKHTCLLGRFVTNTQTLLVRLA